MMLVILLVTILVCSAACNEPPTNSSAKDMYVVHATVYQVGILTNKTFDELEKEQGNQEAITFYHHNGTGVDLSGIRNPLLTNVTAQSLVGIAPVQGTNHTNVLPWDALEKLTSLQQAKAPADLNYNDGKARIVKRGDNTSVPVKLVKGDAVIPPANGVQSLALPPLLTLNNNLSQIPVPIPNTSVVHYAKINTLVKSP